MPIRSHRPGRSGATVDRPTGGADLGPPEARVYPLRHELRKRLHGYSAAVLCLVSSSAAIHSLTACSSSGSGGSDDTTSCPLGSQGCDCTNGGACDLGLKCSRGTCDVPQTVVAPVSRPTGTSGVGSSFPRPDAGTTSTGFSPISPPCDGSVCTPFPPSLTSLLDSLLDGGLSGLLDSSIDGGRLADGGSSIGSLGVDAGNALPDSAFLDSLRDSGLLDSLVDTGLLESLLDSGFFDSLNDAGYSGGSGYYSGGSGYYSGGSTYYYTYYYFI